MQSSRDHTDRKEVFGKKEAEIVDRRINPPRKKTETKTEIARGALKNAARVHVYTRHLMSSSLITVSNSMLGKKPC